MKLGRTGVALAIAGLLVGGVLFGAAVSGEAAVTQQVKAALSCEPGTVTTGTTVGCLLKVTNEGSNTVHSVTVTVVANNGGTFVPSSLELCTPNGTNTTLTCDIGTLTGSGGANPVFTETYELQMPAPTPPADGASVTQTASGRYAQKPNNRGSIVIDAVSDTTHQDDDPDFDGRFSDSETESVATGTGLNEDNPYSTGAALFGSFTVGLSVRERDVNPTTSPNCPSGCFGAQEIDFDITPLDGATFPDTYTLEITIADEAIPNSVKEDELDVRHDTVSVPLCDEDTSPEDEPCIVDRDIDNRTKIATIIVSGPGDQNGSWGVG